jgi:hypothetical protein
MRRWLGDRLVHVDDGVGRAVSHSKISLSRLIDIAWSFWDPIGYAGIEGTSEHPPPAHEYDPYLRHVVSLLENGNRIDEAVAYLIEIESEHMGFSSPNMRERAIKTVEEVREYLDEVS